MAKAKSKGANFVFIGKDGKAAIASATGELTVVANAALLRGDLLELLKKRQAAGKELTEALADANFTVVHSVEILVIDPSGVLNKLGKKKRSRKR
jgi:cytochrome oxidase Cu insertion factor (SCO1/SenC/PrrC family)